MYRAILKGFRVLVHYADGSRGSEEFTSQNAAKAYINGIDVTVVYTVTLSPSWSRPGEVVELEVHTFPPAGD